MNYGLYIAASGASVQMARQEVFSNNLVNLNTVGFRPHVMAIRARDVARVEDGISGMDSDRLLERLGAGVVPSPVRMSVRSGPLEQTGRSLDAAIDGDGFFVVRVGPGADGLRLTRDGRFALSPEGRLVTSADGAPIEGEGGSIQIDASLPLTIHGDGSIEQGGAVVGRLRLAEVADASRLRSLGKGLFAGEDGGEPEMRASSARVVQGMVESSGVQTIDELMQATSASRAAQRNIEMIGMISENMQMAINRLGRVS